MSVMKFKTKNYHEVEAWCMKNIGPRMYYLHNQIGGQGWVIKRAALGAPATVAIEDGHRALMAILMFGFEK